MEPASQLERSNSEAHEKDQLYSALEGLDDRSKSILQLAGCRRKKRHYTNSPTSMAYRQSAFARSRKRQ